MSNFRDFCNAQSDDTMKQCIRDYAELERTGTAEQRSVIRSVAKAWLFKSNGDDSVILLMMDRVAVEAYRRFALRYIGDK
jgi:hypothetical protein